MLSFLRKTFGIVPQAIDDVILYGADDISFRLYEPGIDLVSLVDLLLAGMSESDFVSYLRTTRASRDRVESVIEGLERADLVRVVRDPEGWTTAELQRFDRQLGYFSRWESNEQSRFDIVRKLRKARVLLLGLGSLGSVVLQNLVAAGVGGLTGVDKDRVESSNLARLTLYGESDCGTPKALAAERAIARASSYVDFRGIVQEIGSARDISELLSERTYDLVVLTADRPRLKIAHWAAEAAIESGVPLLRANSLGVGPLFEPGRTACPACEWARMAVEVPQWKNIVELRSRLSSSRDTAIVAGIAVAGAVTSNEVIFFLAGVGPVRTRDARVSVTADLSGLVATPFRREGNCPVCSTLSRVPVI